MCMVSSTRSNTPPSWDALYQVAESQAGHFTLAQAHDCGYSSQALHKHLIGERIERVRRGVYRLTHYPMTENEELVALWLWSDQEGVFSHETALALHDLSDALPAKVHMTVPVSWESRRLRVPEGLVLHFADLRESQCDWHEAVPVTAPKQILTECIDAHVTPEWISHAIHEARQRGLISGRDAMRLTNRLLNSNASQ